VETVNCRDAHTLIHALLDAEISPDGRGDLQEHLEQCSSCRRAMAQLQAMDEGFEWLARTTADLPVEDAPRHTVRMPLVRRVAGAALAAAAVIVFALVMPFDLPKGGQLAYDNSTSSDALSAEAPRFRLELRGESYQRYLAVEEPAGESPRVHVVWLYPVEPEAKGTSGLDTARETIRS